MYEQRFQEDILFCMLYAGVAVMAIIACIYLLFRRGNAFASEITTPSRLRRWTAALFAAIALSHVWYMPILYYTAADDVKQCYYVGGLLDSMTVFPLAVIVLLCMLQDRRRLLWPVGVMAMPLVAGMALTVARGSDDLWPVLNVYLLLLGIGLFIYMVLATRQYGRWLRDNYADLEHKEVWQSFVVLAAILILFVMYVKDIWGEAHKYIIQLSEMVLACYLLWRVETLSDLSPQKASDSCLGKRLSVPSAEVTSPDNHKISTPLHLNTSQSQDIATLLQEHCIDAQLYLQHDLTLQQLAKAIGVNRYYLSQYFSSQGTNYNAYINGLRINHFIGLYREAVATGDAFTTKRLANDSGYRSYSTFSLAFKQRTGQSVTAWMHEAGG